MHRVEPNVYLVGDKLSGQVLDALYEILKGLQAAHGATHGKLLKDVLEKDPNQVYAGCLTLMMRLVFLLYAEDRNLLSSSPVYQNHYSVHGLFEQLRGDANQNPDTMEHRYGAWARLLALFRLIYDGAEFAEMALPARHGHLFDPDRYPFLEGRPYGSERSTGARLNPPLISDGVLFKILSNLLIVDGERISYRSLDVEQIGSIYETMMGFDLMVTTGPSIAVKAKSAKKLGAPAVVNLEELLKVKPADRNKRLMKLTDRRVSGRAEGALKRAATPEDVVAALDRNVSEYTPEILPKGTLILQPSEERRKTGSHYTPRSLTEPIVRESLRPLLQRLGEKPTPDQILDLKVCDPAMGSGAFLVETCRQVADRLVEAWHAHNAVPKLAIDEDELLHARRLVAMRCLYGVDRNPLAVDLAKLSLWLATLAKDHPFTFVDHALRHGDSLVGLSIDQIAAFHWDPQGQKEFVRPLIEEQIAECRHFRDQIRQATEDDEAELDRKPNDADEVLSELKLIADLAVTSFFGASKPKERETHRQRLAHAVREALQAEDAEAILKLESKRNRALVPFHWELEFPEVFDRKPSGFDAFVGNPPFMHGKKVSGTLGDAYLDWLMSIHLESNGNSDFVAHFFRRCFSLVRHGGSMGLIATKTIRQGDTRHTGLRWICTNGGTIYHAIRRHKWEGAAAVVVSMVHITKGPYGGKRILDGRGVETITAFLFHAGGHESPSPLASNAEQSFMGTIILGMGFTFDDTDRKGVASGIGIMDQALRKNPKNRERVLPYIGGNEVNSTPRHSHHRFVIYLEDLSLEDAKSRHPELVRIVEAKVKPERDKQKKRNYREIWWKYAERCPGLYAAIEGLKRVLVINCGASPFMSFTFLPSGYVYANSLTVLAVDQYSGFATLQSRVHEIWARFFGSSLEDRLRYTPSDCFETFPLPPGFEDGRELEHVGEEYFKYRADLMVRNDEGMTDTYNRFHNPQESSKEIGRLRELHSRMDRAVLDSYGWKDLKPTPEFLLDYEVDDEEDDRKKPWRLRWPDDMEDEVLARLIALNQECAQEERRRLGETRDEPPRPRRKKKRKGRAKKNKKERIDCPRCGRSVATKHWAPGYPGLHTHNDKNGKKCSVGYVRPSKTGTGWTV